MRFRPVHHHPVRRSFTLIPRPPPCPAVLPFQLLRSVLSINSASVASWSSRSACGPSAGEVNAKLPPVGPENEFLLDGAVGKGLWNCACEGVWLPNAGDAWINGDVAVERMDEDSE